MGLMRRIRQRKSRRSEKIRNQKRKFASAQRQAAGGYLVMRLASRWSERKNGRRQSQIEGSVSIHSDEKVLTGLPRIPTDRRFSADESLQCLPKASAARVHRGSSWHDGTGQPQCRYRSVEPAVVRDEVPRSLRCERTHQCVPTRVSQRRPQRSDPVGHRGSDTPLHSSEAPAQSSSLRSRFDPVAAPLFAPAP